VNFLSALTASAEVRKGTIGGERQLLNTGQGAAQELGGIGWRLTALRQFLRVSQRIRKAIQRSLKSDANPASWTHVGIATSASKVITNLISGKRYWFRVAAVSAGGEAAGASTQRKLCRNPKHPRSLILACGVWGGGITRRVVSR